MTQDFALTLSFEGISLLRRVAGGWVRVGDVALDADDLRAALAGLRSEADSYSPQGGQVKLVVPNEQIKYLTLPHTGLTGEALRDDIRRALDGATPYEVDDLTFDWELRGKTIHVAAVANETLDEAEAFAKSHHFEPVSFVAVPLDGTFAKEVFFGPAASWTGPAPVRDATPIVEVAAPVVEAPVEEAPDTKTPATIPLFDDLDDDPALADEVEPVTPPPAAPAAAIKPDADEALSPGKASEDAVSARPVLAVTPPDETVPKPAFSSIRATREAPAQAPAAPIPPTPSRASEDSPVKPRLQLGGARKSTRDSDITAPGLQVEATEEPVERKGFGFFSRRKPKDAPEKPAALATPPVPPKVAEANEPIAPAHDPSPARAAVARIAAMRAGRATQQPAPADGAAAAVPDERQRMTIFGARTEPQIGGKPRFLGLMLTSALLIILLAVAAWASVFLDEGISRFFNGKDDTPSIARLPDVDLAPLDGSITDPEADVDGIELASLETDNAVTPDTALAPVLPPPAALTPEEAAATYAATGIWQKSPDAPATPPMTTLDDLYVASIDSRVEQFDAVALPDPDDLRNDQTYLSLPNPALPGTRYTLDERGLVIATPEGTVNPEGVRVFAGLPPVVPPARPAPTLVPAPAETAEVAALPEVAALQAFRPKVRPGGLVEGNERALLAGRTRAELEALRPKPRPETLKAIEEQAQPDATKFAVATSVQPVTRPRNFSNIVEKAREAQKSEPPKPEVTQVASASAVATVQPRIPSTASVAREATVANAINLRKINLIGVYGKPSNRRALVRLANGRYQKVEVGDRLDGGRVAAIGNSELRYTKNGRNVVLDMPDG